MTSAQNRQQQSSGSDRDCKHDIYTIDIKCKKIRYVVERYHFYKNI